MSSPHITDQQLRAAIIRGSQLLFIQNSANQQWQLPGGAMLPDAGIRATLAQHLKAQTGLALSYMSEDYHFHHHQPPLFLRQFYCETANKDEPTLGADFSAHRWVRYDTALATMPMDKIEKRGALEALLRFCKESY